MGYEPPQRLVRLAKEVGAEIPLPPLPVTVPTRRTLAERILGTLLGLWSGAKPAGRQTGAVR